MTPWPISSTYVRDKEKTKHEFCDSNVPRTERVIGILFKTFEFLRSFKISYILAIQIFKLKSISDDWAMVTCVDILSIK